MNNTFCCLLLPSLLCSCVLSAADKPVPTDKRAGVAFRGDDNHNPEKWLRLAEVFERYNAPLCASLNLLRSAHDEKYMAFVCELQARGHEVMDHSPTHRVFSTQFRDASDAASYAGQPGVHHVSGSTVCFQYIAPTSMDGLKTGLADVSGSAFSSADEEVLAKWAWDPLVMLAGDPNVYLFAGDSKQTTPSGLRTLWGEDTVNLPELRGVRFYRLRKDMVGVVPDALRHQARLIRDVCAKHGIRPPTTWIQPGGNEPVLHRSAIKAVFEDEFGYTAAATYPDAARKCFNEYDPDGDKRFGMQWGNFQEDRFDLEHCKTAIADGIARRHVMFGHSHLGGAKEIGGWEGNLRTTEALLKWCREKDIPIRTYSEWAEILYGQPTDPSVNVFPDLGMDLDGNGRPDGITLGPDATVVQEAPDGQTVSLSIPADQRACVVRDLGGVEKGKNTFSLWMCGSVGAKIQVRFTSRDAKIATEWLTFEQTEDNAWQSVTGEVVVPKQASTITIDIFRRDRGEMVLLLSSLSLTGAGR